MPCSLPALVDDPLRRRLSGELHARPPEEIDGSVRAVHFTVLFGQDGDKDRQRVMELCTDYGIAAPGPGADHVSADCGPFRLKWERHSEFSSYTFFYPGSDDEPFATPPATLVPGHWLESLKQQVLVAKYVVLIEGSENLPEPAQLSPLFASKSIAGCLASGGSAALWTDFHIHNDGFSRVLVQDLGLRARQRGRLLQRITEIETYRMMALLAYPLAREHGPRLTQIDSDLAALAERVSTLRVGEDEKPLMYELQGLSAQLENIGAATNYRFGAAQAYYDLVLRRVTELREERISGLPTIREFIERRLAPGMRTCVSVQERIEKLSTRTARLSDLLRTQIDIALETQNRDLLQSMDARARLQLRLQETVESLSVVVLSYYSVGFINYILKSVKSLNWQINVDLLTGASIPIVVLAVWLGIRIMRKRLMRGDAENT